jgi:hypothetical protein
MFRIPKHAICVVVIEVKSIGHHLGLVSGCWFLARAIRLVDFTMPAQIGDDREMTPAALDFASKSCQIESDL